MKFLKQGVCLALLGAGLAAVPGIQASASGTTSAAGEGLVQQMRDTAQGSVALSTESATGKVGFIRAGSKGDLLPTVQGDSLAAAVDKATAYLDKYGAAFGAAQGQLRQSQVQRSDQGWTISFTQSYEGVPVFGAMLKANVDKGGDLTSVNGYVAPGLSLSTSPRLSAAQAADRAIASVRANPPSAKADMSGLKAASNELQVYRMGAIKGEAGAAILAYVVEVTNKRNIRDMVVVDANTDKVVNRWSLVHDALERELYEAFINDNGTPEDEEDDFVDFDLVWAEGDALPGDLNTDQQNLVNTTGDSYWLYENAFGRDSYDGAGATMQVVNNDPRIQCPNANWNGITTNYCDGVTSDDVVAHEWGHAYTEYTSGLIYQWQPGALNESYSDVWGETVDLINGRDDEDEGDIDTPRPVGQCSTHSPPMPLLTINAPEGIAKECLTGGYLGPQPMPTVTGDVVAPTDVDEDADALTFTTLDGCSEYDDAEAANGMVVLVNRGGCTFVQKAEVARDAGAAALIIGNRDEAPVGFSSPDQTLPPTVSIGLSDRESIRTALANEDTVNVTIEDASGERGDSYRWLIGEKSEAFGGAIRDMWNPNCHGDPGKVTDAQYNCSTDDSGGVHGNSGVPNHAYSLLVDGGTFNSVAVTGIGLDKAAAIYWRAQSAHLTPTSDFPDFADALDASCAELVGDPINALSVTPSEPGEPITPITLADCAQVAAASEAVELRTEPDQCDFQPLLAKGAPDACGEGTKKVALWKENFEDGLADWTKGQTVVFEGAHGYPWRATNSAPKHSSRAAYGPGPDEGSCSGDEDDISSLDTLTSPVIKLPITGVRSPRLTFRHYVATEAGFDGGNVEIKINGRPFELVPASVFLFNPYNTTLASEGDGNTNPLAGEPGFSGTDGGSVFGSWGESQINLDVLGVNRGDKLRIRFNMGRDGCGGNDGWYVDNLKILSCVKNAKQLAIKP